MFKIRNILSILFLALFFVVGCTLQEIRSLPQNLLATPTPTNNPVITPTSTAISSPEEQATKDTRQILSIWVPPQFDPESNSESGTHLAERLGFFITENPGVEITSRVKAEDGTASLINSLELANTAAPLTLPSIIALKRSDLETAAINGLIYGIDNPDDLVEDSDWFPYARELSRVQDNYYGYPFAGDILLLLYRPEMIENPPQEWNEILVQGQPLAFPAADPDALVPLSLYFSAGGSILDGQNRTNIDGNILKDVYTLFSDGAQQGIFPVWLTQYETHEHVWQAYKEQSAHWVITWSSRYLSEIPTDTLATEVPTLGETEYNLTDGWIWAVSEISPELRPVAFQLAEYLSESDFVNEWNNKSGYLPVRPSGISTITDKDIQSLTNRLIRSAEVKPSKIYLTEVGPMIKDGTVQIINRESSPEEAVDTIVELISSAGYQLKRFL